MTTFSKPDRPEQLNLGIMQKSLPVASYNPVQHKLLIPFVAVLLMIVCGFCATLLKVHNNNQVEISKHMLGNLVRILDDNLVTQSDALGAIEDVLINDAVLTDALKAQDQSRLLTTYQVVFEQLRQKHGITHFYFHSPDRVNLLRVHKPEMCGDIINRFTVLEAERTGRTVSGIELGLMGTLTLRVVRPIFEGDTLIGYLELGKEIEDILANIHSNDDDELAVSINKSAINRENWESGLVMLNRRGEWDQFPEQLLVYHSLERFPTEWEPFVDKLDYSQSGSLTQVKSNGKTWRAAVIPLIDVSGAQVGKLLAFHDISQEVSQFNRIIVIFTVTVLVILAVLVSFLYVMIRKTDRDIIAQAKNLTESETFLRKVVESHVNPFMVIDVNDHTVLLANKAAFSNGANGTESFHDLIHHHDTPCDDIDNPCPLMEVKKTGKPIIMELTHNGLDDSSKVFEIQMSPIFDENGNVVQVIEYMVDISEQKRAEDLATIRNNKLEQQANELESSRLVAMSIMEDAEQARDAAEQAEKLLAMSDQAFMDRFHAIPDATLLIEGDKFVACNNQAVQMLRGLNEEDILDVHPSDLSPETQPDGRSSFDKANEMIAAAFERGSNQFEWEHQRLDGEVFPVEVTLMPVSLFGKQQLLCIWKDITAKKQVKKSLAEARQAVEQEAHKLRSMIEGMDEGIIVTDNQHNIYEINTWLLEKVFMNRDEVIGQSLWDLPLFKVEAAYLRSVLDSFHTGEYSETQVINRQLLGMQMSIRAQPILEDGQYRGTILNIINVTDLVESRKAAEEANKAKSTFLANMSHEIRTPLNSIMGFTDLLRRGSENYSEVERQDCLDTIHASGKHLLALINDILDLSKVEAGQMEVEHIYCSPQVMVSEVVSMLRPQAIEKELSLEVSFVSPFPEKIESDPGLFKQLLTNIVGNAIKFTDHGGIHIITRLLENSSKPMLSIDVIDTGTGIPKNSLEYIFDPFVQADSTTRRNFGGTGLGLAICKGIVESLGGDLMVKSDEGKGSTFTFTMETGSLEGVKMLEGAIFDIMREKNSYPDLGNKTTVQGRILVVDDGVTNRKLISLALSRIGLETVTAENGQIAVNLAMRETFDLILMDMQMPVMDGYEATRILRERGVQLPIIAVTANAMLGEEKKCLDAGCSGYLAKPIDLDKLHQMLVKELYGATELPHLPKSLPHQTGQEAFTIASTLPTDDPKFREIVEEFIECLSEQLRTMEQARDAGNLAELASLAHWLKGAGGTAGYGVLTEPAAQLEHFAKEGQLEQIETAITHLVKLAGKIVVSGDNMGKVVPH